MLKFRERNYINSFKNSEAIFLSFSVGVVTVFWITQMYISAPVLQSVTVFAFAR